MKITLKYEDNSKALIKDVFGLNAASRAYPLQKGTLRDTLMEQIIFLWKTFRLLPKDNWLTAFIIRPICVLVYEAWHLISFFTHPIKADTTGSKQYCGFKRRHSRLSMRQPHAKGSPG